MHRLELKKSGGAWVSGPSHSLGKFTFNSRVAANASLLCVFSCVPSGYLTQRMPCYSHCTCKAFQLVSFQVSGLSEALMTIWTLKWLFSHMYPSMIFQGPRLSKCHKTIGTFVRLFSCMYSLVSFQMARLVEGHFTIIALVGLLSCVCPLMCFKVAGISDGNKAHWTGRAPLHPHPHPVHSLSHQPPLYLNRCLNQSQQTWVTSQPSFKQLDQGTWLMPRPTARTLGGKGL